MKNKDIKEELLELHRDITAIVYDINQIYDRINNLYNNIEVKYRRGSVKIPSFTEDGVEYTVAWNEDVYTCNCDAFKYYDGNCKHIKAVKEGD